MPSVRILICDDHDLVRRGLRILLENHKGWTVCGDARTDLESIKLATELMPDIVIIDIGMPELNGVEAARQIRILAPHCEILILSMHYSDQVIRDVVEMGVRGYLIKSDSDRDLIKAVETLAEHKPFFTAQAAEVMLSHFRSVGALPQAPGELRERLTSREKEIVKLVTKGKSSKEVADLLGISAKTAETHRSNIMRKLQIHSVSELVHYALRNQIVEP